MARDLIPGGKVLDALEPDEESFAGGALGRTTEELALTLDVPAALVAVDENV
jgi:hypothetical protein